MPAASVLLVPASGGCGADDPFKLDARFCAVLLVTPVMLLSVNPGSDPRIPRFSLSDDAAVAAEVGMFDMGADGTATLLLGVANGSAALCVATLFAGVADEITALCASFQSLSLYKSSLSKESMKLV